MVPQLSLKTNTAKVVNIRGLKRISTTGLEIWVQLQDFSTPEFKIHVECRAVIPGTYIDVINFLLVFLAAPLGLPKVEKHIPSERTHYLEQIDLPFS